MLILTPCRRFEKSLYDLIRGLRSHKGKEEEYIKNCIRECRTEIKSQDMGMSNIRARLSAPALMTDDSIPSLDLKATALLKLIYLEMFGHDMTWVSFHVLEVMSSKKYHHKRVGYLGAVQSFHSDTDVLMLATNLLKKVNMRIPRPRPLQPIPDANLTYVGPRHP